MKKIMFICTGNICRSAMADGLMKKLVKEQNKDIESYSCGIFAENGDMPTFNAIEAIKEYGVDLKNHRATNIRNSKIKDMDIILCATVSHKNNVKAMYPELRDKIFTIKEYAEFDENNLDIPDPWGYDIETYRFCASTISKCLKKIIEKPLISEWQKG